MKRTISLFERMMQSSRFIILPEREPEEINMFEHPSCNAIAVPGMYKVAVLINDYVPYERWKFDGNTVYHRRVRK